MTLESQRTPTDITMDEVEKIVAATGRDSFRLKILRKRSEADPSPMLVATFENANRKHIADIDLWLSELCGGGFFVVSLHHADSLAKRVGLQLPFRVDGSPKQLNINAVTSDTWRGPIDLLTSGGAPAEPNYAGPSTFIGASGQQQASAHVVPGALGHEAVKLARSSSGDTQADAYRVAALLAEAEKVKAEAADLRRQLDIQKVKDESDRKIARLEEAVAQASRTPPQNNGVTEMLALVMKVMEDSARRSEEASRRADEERREQAKQREEDRRASEERFNRMIERQDDRMEKLLESQKNDPLQKLLLERALNPNDSNLGNITKMLEASAMVTNQALGSMTQFMHMKAEMKQLEGGEEETPMQKFLLRGLDIVENITMSRQQQQEEVTGDDDDEVEIDGETVEEAHVVEKKKSALQKFDDLIFALTPAKDLVKPFMVAAETKEFRDVWAKYEGNLERLAEARYGAWALEDYEARVTYLKKELRELAHRLVKMGVVQQAPDTAPRKPAPVAAKPKKNGKAKAEVVEAPAVEVTPAPPAPEVEA